MRIFYNPDVELIRSRLTERYGLRYGLSSLTSMTVGLIRTNIRSKHFERQCRWLIIICHGLLMILSHNGIHHLGSLVSKPL
jgi:hypothetical protein